MSWRFSNANTTSAAADYGPDHDSEYDDIDLEERVSYLEADLHDVRVLLKRLLDARPTVQTHTQPSLSTSKASSSQASQTSLNTSSLKAIPLDIPLPALPQQQHMVGTTSPQCTVSTTATVAQLRPDGRETGILSPQMITGQTTVSKSLSLPIAQQQQLPQRSLGQLSVQSPVQEREHSQTAPSLFT